MYVTINVNTYLQTIVQMYSRVSIKHCTRFDIFVRVRVFEGHKNPHPRKYMFPLCITTQLDACCHHHEHVHVPAVECWPPEYVFMSPVERETLCCSCFIFYSIDWSCAPFLCSRAIDLKLGWSITHRFFFFQLLLHSNIKGSLVIKYKGL